MALRIHVDGGARGNPGPAGAGVVIHRDGKPVYEAGYYLGRQTNNAAEYLALIRALEHLGPQLAEPLEIRSDSELLVRQITHEYQVKSPGLRPLFEQAMGLLLKVSVWSIRHVPREENGRADELANLAMDERGDVIALDALGDVGGAATEETALDDSDDADASPVDDADPVQVTAAETPDRPVRVGVVNPPQAGACPAGGCGFSVMTVRATLPEKVCVHAAHAIVPTLLAIQNTEPAEFSAVPTLTVRCMRAGCGATFQLNAATSSNGRH